MAILFVALGVIALMLAIAVCTGCFASPNWELIRENEDAFDRKFPPISDGEFLARCPPGTTPEVALGVRRMVSDQLGVPYDQIYPSSRFVVDLGAD